MPERDLRPPERHEIHDAAARLQPHLPAVGLLESEALGAVLQLECLQPTGSFKVRGALAALGRLEPGTRVVAASAGNHGLGVAWAAARLGVDATVVVPETASPAKIEALRRFERGSEAGTGSAFGLVVHGADYDGAEAHALERAAEGRRYVSPYNDRDVVAGQGTVAVELLGRVDPPLTIVCPVSGGGLCAGVALWASGVAGARVVGVVPEASPAMRAALDAGRIVPVAVHPTLADGLAGNIEPGAVTFELVRRFVDDVVAVSEEEIAAAMRVLAGGHGLVVEGAGAAAAAALLAGRVERRGRVVALVTGRNVAADTFAAVLRAGG
jgi:threonine dehydratase